MDPLEVLVRQCGGTEEMRYKHIVCVDSLAWKQYKDVFYTTITYVIALLVESHQKKKKNDLVQFACKQDKLYSL